MMPHPAMRFAWEEDVLRCSRILVLVFVLVVAAAMGGIALIDRTQEPASVVAEKPVKIATISAESRTLADSE
jgi:hypothetical protein